MNQKSNVEIKPSNVFGEVKPEKTDMLDNKETFSLNFHLEFEKLDETVLKNTHFFQERFDKLENGGKSCNDNTNSIEEALNSLCEFNIAMKKIQLECDNISETKNIYSRKIKDTSGNVVSFKDKNKHATDEAQETEKKLELLKIQFENKENISLTSREIIKGDLEKIQDVLGLQIVTSTRGGIVLSFTNIDKLNPSKKFICHLGFGKKKYEAIDSDPALPQLDKLVDILNQTNDLSGFVQTIRKLFEQRS